LKTPEAESLKEKITNCKAPLWRSVFVECSLVGLLTLILLTLDFVWLLYLSYNCQMNKENIWSNGFGYIMTNIKLKWWWNFHF